MPKVKNTKRNPLDIEIDGEDNTNLNLGPRETSRELSAEEMQSDQVQANIAVGNLVVIEEAAAEQPAGKKVNPKKEGDE